MPTTAKADGLRLPLVHIYSATDIGTAAQSWITKQGPDGILYFGINSLVSLDGDHWAQASIKDVHSIRGLDFGLNGKLWAAADGEIGSFEQEGTGQWIYHSLAAHLPPQSARLGEVWHAFSEGNGAIFVTAEKILRWDGGKFQVWSFPGTRRLPAMRVGSDIYVHHVPTGLYVMDRDGPKLVIPASVLGKSTVLWMELQSNGFLLATSEGLYTYENGKLTNFALEASKFVSANYLTSAVRLEDGRLALGTFQGGLAIVKADGSLDRILSTKDGLPTNSIYSLFIDRSGELWVTSGSGIFRISMESASAFFDKSSGLPSQPINKIVRNGDRITLTSDNKLFEFLPDQGRFESLDSVPNYVWELQPVPDGLFIGGLGRALKLTNGKAALAYSTQQDVTRIIPSHFQQSAMLISEGYRIVLLQADGTSRVLVENLSEFVTSIAEDSQGRLWLGTSTRGILLAKPSTQGPVEAVSADRAFGLPDNSGQGRVVASSDGTVFAFTSSGGWILKRDAAKFTSIENYPTRSTNAVSEVAADGTLWVVHPSDKNRAATAAKISIQGDRAVWQPHSVEGLWDVGSPTCILAEAGSNGDAVLWIGGTTGLVRNVVKGGPVAPVPHAPLLRALARNADTDTLQAITQSLPYSTRAIDFEFSAPEFARRPALRIETMLDGIDKHWMPADVTSRREFTALREGQYTFRVRVVAETGVTSTPAISHFVITPPWWRTGTALAGLLLALCPAGYGVYRWRVRALRQHNTELETKVRERTTQLAQASAAKTQFIANMSHDIRNPLNGIVGLALALEDTPLDSKQNELVSTLRECTTYLSTLVDDVLDFASIEAGAVELRPGPFSPNELLRSIAAMFKMEAIASGASLIVETDPRLPAAYVGDAGRIQQILVNFLTNALKYSGGRIRLTASIPTDATEEIEFAVTDEGPGISSENQRQLFTKFSRLTNAQSKEITGSGLGLASCRLLAGLMTGSVGVRSRPGHGARFFLRLPLEIVPLRAPDPVGAPMAEALLPNCTVLLVEDTNYNAWAASAVLAKFGLTCERASSGAEALELFAKKHYNLVLLDRNLPDMDGTEVARRIRALEADGPRAIMLAVTAYCTTEDRALCLSAGMDAFVGKPLTPEKLRRVLTAAGRRHLAAASMHISPNVSATGVDVSLLQYISDGTEQGLTQQIELFLSALEEAEKQLSIAALNSNFKLLGDAAHGVLSHARLVGCSSLATAAAGLQRSAQAESRDAFGEPLLRVSREIQSLKAIVRHYPGAERPA